MTVRFSVFIPVWNGTDWLPGAIETVLSQSYPEWELVIGDNLSTDDIEAIVKRFPDPRIRYHRWPTHTDINENFNRTMLLCKYDWLQLLSVDDRLASACLEKMAACIESASGKTSRLAMVLSAAQRVHADGRSADPSYYGYMGRGSVPEGLHNAQAWLRHATVGVKPWDFGAAAIARDVLAETGGFRPDIGLCADVELAIRVSTYGDVAYIDEPLMSYAVWSNSDTGSRAFRKRAWDEPVSQFGIALLAGLRVHEERREVSKSERAGVYAAVARWQLQRAFQHRYQPGGWGWRGALLDVLRATRYSPRTVLTARNLMYALSAVLAPPALIGKMRSVVLERQYPATA